MKQSDTSYKVDIRSNEKIYSLANLPTEKDTQGELVKMYVDTFNSEPWNDKWTLEMAEKKANLIFFKYSSKYHCIDFLCIIMIQG